MEPTAASVRTETEHRVRRHAHMTGATVRRMRLGAGLSLTALARVASIDPTHLARIEAGAVIASINVLTAIGVALGCDASFRYFEGVGPRLHDRFQAPMMEGFLRCVHPGRWNPTLEVPIVEPAPRWNPTLEVPIVEPARGVIDLVLDERRAPLAVAGEIQSRLARLEQEIRWMAEKADGLADRRRAMGQDLVVSRLLVLRSTTDTRALANRYSATFATAFPARSADVVAALTTPDAPWPGAGIVWMRVERGEAQLLKGPPRGVRFGR